jgi:two-component system, NarL family, response regulator LiaR
MALVKVSIIEDDKSYREGLEMVIGNSDYFKVLHSYPSAEIALPHIIHNPPEIVIVDIKLPGKSGVDAIAVIKQQLPDVLCMVCSFYDDNEYIYNALQNGASGYILKDSMPGDMIDTLKDLHQGGAPMSRYIAKKVITAFQQKKTLPSLSELTDRENEVLQLIATGLGIKEVGDKLNLSPHTITKHLKNIYNKLHVNNRIEAVNRLNQSKQV